MDRRAPCWVSAVERRSVRRRYTVSSRCNGVSVSEIWDLCGGKALTLRPFLQPTYEEGLAAAVFAAHGLESATARRHRSQLLVQCRIERIKTNCEQIETLARYRSAPEGIDDLASSLCADHGDSCASTSFG